jgi:hypothetical protein
MTPLFKKLNYKSQQLISIFNSPPDLHPLWEAQAEFCQINLHPKTHTIAEFIIIFCGSQKDVERTATFISDISDENSIVYCCYPKQSSKKYKTDINRDNGWSSLGALGYEVVRAVAIDEDWSALRFKPVGRIKNWTRNFALSEEGKKRIKKKS